MARPGRGYTFLEVLVAAALVVVVVGLLVPAVMKLRAAAARAKCANHLKQIGTAFLAHHDARGYFPPGGAAAPDPLAASPAAREAGGWGWAYFLLPHLGHEGLYANPDPDAVRRAPVSVFLCPARRDAYPNGEWAKLDYAANGGSDPDGATGVLARTGTPPLRLADFRGGSAGAVIVAGKRLNRAALGRSRDDDDAYPTAGWTDDFETHRVSAEPPAPDADEPGNLDPRRGFGSSHPGVFCAAFADGSVRPLRYTLDPAVWRKACHRDGSPAPPSPNNE